LICHSDEEVVVDATWALSYLNDGDDDRLDACMQAGVVPAVLRKFQALSTHGAGEPALRTIGNFASGGTASTQALLDGRVLELLSPLLGAKKETAGGSVQIVMAKPTVRKEACWTVSNIAAGTPAQINALLAAPGILPGIVTQLKMGPLKAKKEAAWARCSGSSGW
jgi:hypothetical protein